MARSRLSLIREALQRKRVFDSSQLEIGDLRRCLNHWDLTALGVGSTLGVGIYVLVGSVALHLAGPSIVLSFLIAAVASLFAGLCYAEFGSRVPKAGSAYIYTYVTVGELAAFIIGWNIIIESMFGTASVARGLSMYVDSMLDQAMSTWFQSVAPIGNSEFTPYFDFFSFTIVVVLGVLMAIGVRESSIVNNVCAVVNMAVILFVVVVGAFKANVKNWNIPPEEVPENYGTGGFFPYGVSGMVRGAAVCFYGFVGFDSISSTGEEVYEPRRTIPRSIITVLFLVLISYTSVATVITMMVPYYQQESVASVALVFTHVGLDWARWVVSIGAIFGIFASLFGAMFPLPRLLYAMASDGLLFHWFAKVSSKRKSPVIATLLPAACIAILAAILELEQLVLMMCIGTLLSYTIVASSVIILRYNSEFKPDTAHSILKQLFGIGDRTPTKTTSRIVDVSLALFIASCIVMALVAENVKCPWITLLVFHLIALCLVIVMWRQPQVNEKLSFKTPLVPMIPCLSIYVNIHLMMLISVQTWIRIVIWILIGIPVYIVCICCYKKNNSIHELHVEKNGKPTVQIIVESPTPPDTIKRSSNYGGDRGEEHENENPKPEKTVQTQNKVVAEERTIKIEEIIVQHAITENNEEREAKIIDLLDQVLQAEEDSYGEVTSLQQGEDDIIVSTEPETIPHRKSLSELSDAGSDASLGNQVLSKYDVIAQVHREDLPRVNEEEDKNEKEADFIENIDEHEQITAFNESETNSRTDESGYSDTLDKTALNESNDDTKEEAPNIPTPPPLDEDYFANPTFKKSYSLLPRERPTMDEEEESKPRDSINSTTSQDDGNITFGSDRQMSFMSKLNNIFQNKITSQDDKEGQRQRSHSIGSINDSKESSVNHERPTIFLDLKKELLSREAAQNLRPVNSEENRKSIELPSEEENDEEENGMSRDDLKSKLETIFASGGLNLLKPRLMKSNPPTPEESYHTDTSSTESIPKTPKIEKNDTLKRQKAKFGEVLNSFRLSLNKDDD